MKLTWQIIVFLLFTIITSASMSEVSNAQSVNPCCTITAIDKTTGIVSATETATGKNFQFKQLIPGVSPIIGLQAPGALAFINSLTVGQAIYADFSSGRVAINDVQVCCIIVRSVPLAPAK